MINNCKAVSPCLKKKVETAIRLYNSLQIKSISNGDLCGMDFGMWMFKEEKSIWKFIYSVVRVVYFIILCADEAQKIKTLFLEGCVNILNEFLTGNILTIFFLYFSVFYWYARSAFRYVYMYNTPHVSNFTIWFGFATELWLKAVQLTKEIEIVWHSQPKNAVATVKRGWRQIVFICE